MDCSWNARRVAGFLQRAAGVVETALDPRPDTVVVEYDPGRTSEAVITAAVEDSAMTSGRRSTDARSRHRSGGCQCGRRHRSR